MNILLLWYEDLKFKVSQSCPTLCDPMDCSLPASSTHGIFQARILEWVAISFSRGSSRPRDRTQASHITGRHFTVWATKEAFKVWSAGILLWADGQYAGDNYLCVRGNQGAPQVSFFCLLTSQSFQSFIHSCSLIYPKHRHDSHCCKAEINTTLWSNHSPIKNKFKK